MSELDEYIPMIDAIIIASNPDEVSPKKIRKAVQELFAVDLDSKRKKVNELIVERFHEIQKQPKVLITKEELRKKDEALARALKQQASKIAPNVKVGSTSKTTKSTSKKKRKVENQNSNSINVRKVRLSEPLQALLGEEELSRTQVVKQVWDYIKEHDLQNPDDRREILCDDKMKPVFGDKMTMFQLNKILVNHLFSIDEVTLKKDPEFSKKDLKKIKRDDGESVDDMDGNHVSD